MMIYRCTACTRDHYTAQQPAICAGCSLSAGSFSMIHLAEPEPDDERPEIERDIEFALSQTPPHHRRPGYEGPPTPRDGPTVDLLENVISRPSEPDGEAPDVEQLRPVDDKPPGICSQRNCYETATHRFTWPGHPEAGSCHAHALKAVLIAERMGFFLEAPAIDAPRP